MLFLIQAFAGSAAAALNKEINTKNMAVMQKLKDINDLDTDYLMRLQKIEDAEDMKIGLQLTNHANTLRILFNNISIYLSIYQHLNPDQTTAKKIIKDIVKTNQAYINDLRKNIRSLIRYPLTAETKDFAEALYEIIDDTGNDLKGLREMFDRDIKNNK